MPPPVRGASAVATNIGVPAAAGTPTVTSCSEPLASFGVVAKPSAIGWAGASMCVVVSPATIASHVAATMTVAAAG